MGTLDSRYDLSAQSAGARMATTAGMTLRGYFPSPIVAFPIGEGLGVRYLPILPRQPRNLQQTMP